MRRRNRSLTFPINITWSLNTVSLLFRVKILNFDSEICVSIELPRPMKKSRISVRNQC